MGGGRPTLVFLRFAHQAQLASEELVCCPVKSGGVIIQLCLLLGLDVVDAVLEGIPLAGPRCRKPQQTLPTAALKEEGLAAALGSAARVVSAFQGVEEKLRVILAPRFGGASLQVKGKEHAALQKTAAGRPLITKNKFEVGNKGEREAP